MQDWLRIVSHVVAVQVVLNGTHLIFRVINARTIRCFTVNFEAEGAGGILFTGQIFSGRRNVMYAIAQIAGWGECPVTAGICRHGAQHHAAIFDGHDAACFCLADNVRTGIVSHVIGLQFARYGAFIVHHANDSDRYAGGIKRDGDASIFCTQVAR